MEQPSPANIFSYLKQLFSEITGKQSPTQIKSCSNNVPCFEIPECDNGAIIDARELKGKEWIYFFAVGGCGLSALKQGYVVSGSDMMSSNAMDALQEAGSRVYLGHSVLNLRKNNGLVPYNLLVTSAIYGGNVEILHAESGGVPVLVQARSLVRQDHKAATSLLSVGPCLLKGPSSAELVATLYWRLMNMTLASLE